jgi:hypothetical protein
LNSPRGKVCSEDTAGNKRQPFGTGVMEFYHIVIRLADKKKGAGFGQNPALAQLTVT